jgi:hypothetical protein
MTNHTRSVKKFRITEHLTQRILVVVEAIDEAQAIVRGKAVAKLTNANIPAKGCFWEVTEHDDSPTHVPFFADEYFCH